VQPLVYAVVNRDGTLLHGDNVLSVEHLDVGSYRVTFAVPTTVQVVSVGDPEAGRRTAAAWGGDGPNAVDVFVCDEAQSATVIGIDSTFQLVAY
jgi:hypothetical protein